MKELIDEHGEFGRMRLVFMNFGRVLQLPIGMQCNRADVRRSLQAQNVCHAFSWALRESCCTPQSRSILLLLQSRHCPSSTHSPRGPGEVHNGTKFPFQESV